MKSFILFLLNCKYAASIKRLFFQSSLVPNLHKISFQFQEFQLSVRGIGGLPDNITLGLHGTNNRNVVPGKESKPVIKEKKETSQGRKESEQSHSMSETDVNIGYTGIDMKRELQINFGKLETTEIALQVDYRTTGCLK